jgi:hypothetical protein
MNNITQKEIEMKRYLNGLKFKVTDEQLEAIMDIANRKGDDFFVRIKGFKENRKLKRKINFQMQNYCEKTKLLDVIGTTLFIYELDSFFKRIDEIMTDLIAHRIWIADFESKDWQIFIEIEVGNDNYFSE